MSGINNPDQYLYKRSDSLIWQVRVKVPSDLRSILGTHLQASLKTKNKAEANQRKRAVLAALFDRIKAAELSIINESGQLDERALRLAEYRKLLASTSHLGTQDEIESINFAVHHQLESMDASEDEGRYVFSDDTEFLPVFEEWALSQGADKDTVSRVRRTKRELTEFMGGTFFIQAVTPKRARAFLASLTGAKSTKKARQHILSRFWEHLVDSELVAVNPWVGVTVEGDRGSSLNTRPFEDYELVKLLQGVSSQPSFWKDLCVIALVTGARLEEIAQLKVDDLFEYDGGFIVTMEKGKTDGETKRVPVYHSVGCEVLSRRMGNDIYLFPECEAQADDTRRSKYFSKRFSEWKTKRLGFGKDVNFHSFRRYLARHFRQTVKDAPAIVSKAFLGHKIKDVDMTFGLYAGAVSVNELSVIAKRLSFPEPVEIALR